MKRNRENHFYQILLGETNMKALKEILDTQMEKMKPTKFYRFQLFVKGTEKKNTVGMAYLKEGQGIYTLRLWTF
jgi:hypothetical protein